MHRRTLDRLISWVGLALTVVLIIAGSLLNAVVSSSLAAGSRRMSKRKVLVKRPVWIEDLGNVDVLFTDKTGTLTAGRIEYTDCSPRRCRRDQSGGPEPRDVGYARRRCSQARHHSSISWADEV